MKVIRRIFIVYCIILFILLLFKFDLSINSIMDKMNSVRSSRKAGAWNINLIPFRTISSQLRLLKSMPMVAVKNIAGNIIVFVPFGFLFPMGYETMRRLHKILTAGLIYILMIEFIQFIGMLGSLDVDDIILNVIGVYGGYVIFWVFRKVWRQRKQLS